MLLTMTSDRTVNPLRLCSVLVWFHCQLLNQPRRTILICNSDFQWPVITFTLKVCCLAVNICSSCVSDIWRSKNPVIKILNLVKKKNELKTTNNNSASCLIDDAVVASKRQNLEKNRQILLIFNSTQSYIALDILMLKCYTLTFLKPAVFFETNSCMCSSFIPVHMSVSMTRR